MRHKLFQYFAQNLMVRIVTYIMAIIIFFLILIWYDTPKNNKPFSSLGNILSAYLYCTNVQCSKATVNWHLSLTNYAHNRELRKFYSKFNWDDITVDPLNYKSGYGLTWLQIDLDGSSKPNYLTYWQQLRPKMQMLYSKILPVKHYNLPIVHFRCSDIPFIKHQYYHLTKAATVEWMAKIIKARGYNDIVMLNCDKHWSEADDHCSSYAKFYSKIFAQQGLRVHSHCGTIVQDFALMYSAPLLVSLNNSSYSFMAGVAKDPNNYIACNIGMELDGRYIPQTEGDWLFASGPPLLHASVEDYRDVDAVLELLQS